MKTDCARNKYGIYEVKFPESKFSTPIVSFGGGNISISGIKSELQGVGLILTEMDDSKEIGFRDSVKDLDYDSDKILLQFDNKKSVDVLIDMLMMIKDGL